MTRFPTAPLRVAPAGALALAAALAVALAAPAPAAQVTPTPSPPPQDVQDGWSHLHTWEADAIVVTGEELPELREEERIGPYGQPRWTTHRRFPGTRVYVVPEGEVEFEYWQRVDEPRHGETQVRHMYEVEIGLPHRLQLDLYAVAKHTGDQRPLDINRQMIELRWALADWGQLWGNPALYLELINNEDDPEAVEGKLLLGDEAAPGWHWGANLVVEQETGGARERSVELTAGLAKTIVDETFSLGGEIKIARINEKESRDDFTDEFLIGPSVQWRPNERCFVDFAPLVGVGAESPKGQVVLVVGWEF